MPSFHKALGLSHVASKRSVGLKPDTDRLSVSAQAARNLANLFKELLSFDIAGGCHANCQVVSR